MNFIEVAYQNPGDGQADRAYGRLRADIVCGRLPPGAALSENRLAEELGVSRTPVREALIKLADDGLVRIVPKSGTFVSLVDLEAVLDSQLIRESLECAAVFLAARRITPDQGRELQLIVDHQRDCVASGDHVGFVAADDDFHVRLIELSGRPGLLKAVQAAKLHLDRVRYLTIETTPHVGEILDQHHDIVERVIAHDGRGARRAMRLHMRMVLAKLDQLAWSGNVLMTSAAETPWRRPIAPNSTTAG